MKYVVVSTYPRAGTQNIGDKLIERSTAAALTRIDPDARVEAVGRDAEWGEVGGAFDDVDHVIFACLAIRNRMAEVYPFLERLLDIGCPVSAISAGTSLKPHLPDLYGKGFGAEDIALLRRFDGAAQVFTTRGALTQAFCARHGLGRAVLSGDIAFYDPRFDDRRFVPRDTVRRIIISDPHYAEDFADTFRRLAQGLAELFPEARIDCALHGVNPAIETLAREIGLGLRPIYLDPERGLDIYDEYDLHAGFRVHGHVSALQRRIPSYLLEQDGRGADYGLTLGRKISVPCYRAQLARKGDEAGPRRAVPPSAAEFLCALIAGDAAERFGAFLGFEAIVSGFSARPFAAIAEICGAAPR